MSEHRISLDSIARMRDGTGHSIFGASGSAMFLACSGSLIPNVLAADAAGYDAAWGTVAHGLSETWLITGRAPTHLVGTNEFIEAGEWGHVIDITDEMLYHVERCVDVCEWLPGDHVVEEHVDYSHITPIPNQGGTLDFAAMQPGRAHLRDHKFGSSPENIVFAEENPQLMLYAIGLNRRYGEKYGFKDFVLGINQPRLDHFDEWVCSIERLREFEAYAKERMAAAWVWDAPRTPGPNQCRFCKVRASCGANAKMMHDLVVDAFMDETIGASEVAAFKEHLEDESFEINTVPVAELSTRHMAKLLPWRSTIESYLKALEEELNKRAARGEQIPGHKVVETRTHRKFREPAKALSTLTGLGLERDQLITEKMVSPNASTKLLRSKLKLKPAQIEKLMSGLIYKPPGRAALVPLSDKRPAVQDVTGLVFGPVESDETEEEI